MNYLASEYFEKLAAAPPSHFGVSPTGHSTAQLRAFLSGYTPNKGVMLGRLGLAGAAMAIPHGEMIAAPLLVGASGVNAVRNTVEMNKQIARGKRVFGTPVAAAQAPPPAMPAAEQPIAPVAVPEKAAAMTVLSFPISCNFKIAGALGTIAGGLTGAALGATAGAVPGIEDMAIGAHMNHMSDGLDKVMDTTPPTLDSQMAAADHIQHQMHEFGTEQSNIRGMAGAGAGVGAIAGGVMGHQLTKKHAALEYFQSI